MNIKEVKNRAKQLIYDDFENTEYARGICELIGDLDGVEDLPLGERAVQIAIELGANKEFINKMY